MLYVEPHPDDIVKPAKGKGKGPAMGPPKYTSEQMAKLDPWLNLPLPAAPIDDDDLNDEYDEMRDYDAPPKADGAVRKYYDYEYNPSDKYDTNYYRNMYNMQNMKEKELLIMLKKDIDDLKLQIKDSCNGSYVIPPGSVGGDSYESVGGENSSRAKNIKEDRAKLGNSAADHVWMQFANKIALADPPIYTGQWPLRPKHLYEHYNLGKPLVNAAGESVVLKLPPHLEPPVGMDLYGPGGARGVLTDPRFFNTGALKNKWTVKTKQKRRTRRTRRKSTRSRRSRRRVRKQQ